MTQYILQQLQKQAVDGQLRRNSISWQIDYPNAFEIKVTAKAMFSGMKCDTLGKWVFIRHNGLIYHKSGDTIKLFNQLYNSTMK